MEGYNSHFEQILNLYQAKNLEQEHKQVTKRDEQSSRKASQKSLEDFL
jgi:hypothetical protein